MERQFPKNVKQIGNVSDSPRIYVEDYVETFLNQLEEQGREVTITAFLLGEKVQIEGEECIFVTGALQVKDSILEEIDPVITKEELETAKVESREYFHEMDIIGWFQTVPDRPLALSREMAKAHEKLMPEKNSLLILKGQEEELYFAYKFKELMEIGGHYIFYEKNPDMQSYMIRERRQIGVTPSEVVEDRAAKDFRIAVRDQMQVRKKKERQGAGRMASAALALLVLVMGVTLLNNFDKMKQLQKSVETMSEGVGEEKTTAQKSQEKKRTAAVETTEIQNKVSSEIKDEVQADEEDRADGEGTGQGSEEEYYFVERGDTLDSISKKIYGDSSEVDAICKMNGLSDGNLIYIGQKLLLP